MKGENTFADISQDNVTYKEKENQAVDRIFVTYV